jgi:hypothetical protein
VAGVQRSSPALNYPPPAPPLQGLGKRLPFAFLADLEQQFAARYGAVAAGAVAYEMNTEFAPVLRDRMAFFNTDPRCVCVCAGGRGGGGAEGGRGHSDASRFRCCGDQPVCARCAGPTP